MSNKVKGIKFGTLSQYRNLPSHDPDTLYFITDKGCIYRGESIVIPRNYQVVTQNGSGASETCIFSIETFGLGGEQSTTQQFTVYTTSAVQAISMTLNQAIATHAAAIATSAQLGHVKLSDATDDDEHDAAYGETHNETYAATPYAVAKVKEELTDYVDTQIAGLSSGMTIIGTYGIAADSPDESDPLDDIQAAKGDTYICISTMQTVAYHNSAGAAATISLNPGDYIICTTAAAAGTPACWTIVPNQTANAVTTDEAALTAETVILGAGGKKVRDLNAGQTGQFLRQGSRGPQWLDHLLDDHGIGHGTCTDGPGTPKTVTIGRDYTLQEGSIVAVTFTKGADANDTLNVSGTGAYPIIHRGAPLAAGVIDKGDTALLMKTTEGSGSFSISRWLLLCVDRTTDLPTSLSAFANDIQGIGTCTDAPLTSPKHVDIPGVAIRPGSVFAVTFTYAVRANALLSVNTDTAKYIRHSGGNIDDNQINGGDTATFIYDGSYYYLLSVDRKIDLTPTNGSNHFVTSNGIYQAVQDAIAQASLQWEELESVGG